MRVVHVTPCVDDASNGTTYTSIALNRALRETGLASRLAAATEHSAAPAQTDPALSMFSRGGFPRRLGRSPDLLHWLRTEIQSGRVDIVHGNGNWMMPNLYSGWATRNSGVPLVVSPHGTFAPWALRRSRVVKCLFWHGLQKRAIAHAALFHATADSEYEDIRRIGFRQPVAVVPNGVDIPAPESACSPREKTLLFLGRVHPVKGVDLLLRVWAGLQSAFPDWHLRIVGPGEAGYLGALQAQARALAAERVTFVGPLHGDARLRAYRSASLFVLPTRSENFGLAVAEALAAGCPVVTTKRAPWSGLAAHRAGWWVEPGAEPLARALGQAMSKDPGELVEMGAQGRAWMVRDFAWGPIAARMAESYRWIRLGGARPEWVRHD